MIGALSNPTLSTVRVVYLEFLQSIIMMIDLLGSWLMHLFNRTTIDELVMVLLTCVILYDDSMHDRWVSYLFSRL